MSPVDGWEQTKEIVEGYMKMGERDGRMGE